MMCLLTKEGATMSRREFKNYFADALFRVKREVLPEILYFIVLHCRMAYPSWRPDP
jgi:hypothetical protein